MQVSANIITPRLELCPCKPEDGVALHRLWTEPQVRQYLWDDAIISLDQVESIIHSSMTCFAQHGYGQWCIFPKHLSPKQPNNLIGFCGLRSLGNSAEIELLYGLASEYWGYGLATEATRAIVQYGFEQCGLEQIRVEVDRSNVASQRVAEKLGMPYEKAVLTVLGNSVSYQIQRQGLTRKSASDAAW